MHESCCLLLSVVHCGIISVFHGVIEHWSGYDAGDALNMPESMYSESSYLSILVINKVKYKANIHMLDSLDQWLEEEGSDTKPCSSFSQIFTEMLDPPTIKIHIADVPSWTLVESLFSARNN